MSIFFPLNSHLTARSASAGTRAEFPRTWLLGLVISLHLPWGLPWFSRWICVPNDGHVQHILQIVIIYSAWTACYRWCVSINSDPHTISNSFLETGQSFIYKSFNSTVCRMVISIATFQCSNMATVNPPSMISQAADFASSSSSSQPGLDYRRARTKIPFTFHSYPTNIH